MNTAYRTEAIAKRATFFKNGMSAPSNTTNAGPTNKTPNPYTNKQSINNAAAARRSWKIEIENN